MSAKVLLGAGASFGLAAVLLATGAVEAKADQPWWLMRAAYPAGQPQSKVPRRAATKAQARQEEAQAPAELPPAEEKAGVLTRQGVLVIEPSIEYQHTDINRFVVGGVAILDTVLVGSIEATQANRDAVTGTLGLRYGITNRLEAELRIPYMYRQDSTTNTVVNTNNTVATTSLTDHGLGDIEGAVHYQVNEGEGSWPFFVANLRVKSTTGTGPYDTKRNSLGIEEELATGSGFWGIEPSLTVIAPSDPAVFYANIGYLWNVARDIDKVVANNRTVSRVDPGDAIRFGVGMGLSLNEKVSFSIGYQHDWIMKTTTTFAETGDFNSETLNVGSMNFGVNWQISPDTALNVNIGIGVTNDAPDVRLMARMPIALTLF
ncbi:MAG: transporter [Magnetospirillum sp.]|nr:transporter [Magnetospirillum sp.]